MAMTVYPVCLFGFHGVYVIPVFGKSNGKYNHPLMLNHDHVTGLGGYYGWVYLDLVDKNLAPCQIASRFTELIPFGCPVKAVD